MKLLGMLHWLVPAKDSLNNLYCQFLSLADVDSRSGAMAAHQFPMLKVLGSSPGYDFHFLIISQQPNAIINHAGDD